MVDSRALLAEAHRRVTAKAEARGVAGRFIERRLAKLHPKQRAYVADVSKRKAALCTRRAGKTTGEAEELVIGAVDTPATKSVYATLTRERAKDLMWPELKRIDYEEQAGFRFNEVELTATMPEQLGGSVIKLFGADKAKEIEKRRGDKYRRARIDEAQAFGPYLETFVEDVLTPALLDFDGDLGLCGTPGPVAAGYFYEVTTGRRPGWVVHRWSVLDNAYLPHAAKWLEQQRRERGWTDTHPTYLREWCGQWVNDTGALVYRYEDARNGFDVLPEASGWLYALGVDLGSGGENDPMAAHVWGWTPELPELYEVRSWKSPDGEPCTTRRLMEDVVLPWREELGGFLVQTIDTGGGGKLTAQDIADRYGVDFEPAKKTEKHLHIRLMNDDLLAGMIKVRRNGPLAAEWRALPKDPDDPTKEHPAYPNHSADSALYPWRLCRHFWHQPQEVPPKPGTPEFYAQQEREMERRLVESALAEEEFRNSWGY